MRLSHSIIDLADEDFKVIADELKRSGIVTVEIPYCWHSGAPFLRYEEGAILDGLRGWGINARTIVRGKVPPVSPHDGAPIHYWIGPPELLPK